MGLISQQNTNPIDCSEKLIVGASTEDSYFSAYDKNEKPPPLDALKILTCLVMYVNDLISLQLDHDPKHIHLFIFQGSVLEILCRLLSSWTYLYYNFGARKYIS